MCEEIAESTVFGDRIESRKAVRQANPQVYSFKTYN